MAALPYSEIKRYVDEERLRGVGKETLRKRLSTLHMTLVEAVRMGWLAAVPPWPILKSDTQPKEAFWRLPQWEAADAACDDEELRIWVMVGWWTGMHTRDLNRFRVEDVDLAGGTWVRRNSKTNVKPLVLPLPNRLRDGLKAAFNRRDPHKRDLVAGRDLGHPNRAMWKLCERAGVPRMGPIGFRHSCETFMGENGCTEFFRMTWLGLKSERMLKKHYRHLTDPIIDRGISAMNSAA